MKKPKPKKDEIKTDSKALTLEQSKRLIESMATVSIANGADVVSVSKKLGHAAPSITLNIYSHANQEAQLRANKTLESALYKKA